MIIHIDMDAFYASVEERANPELRGKPLAVGGSAEARGVVSAANYAARRYGVHSAMPMSRARQLCPQLIVLPVRMQHYAEISRRIRHIFQRYTPVIEPLALDEAFLDVRGSEQLFGPPIEIARRIQEEIKTELGLSASVGVAPNKFLAKLASDLEKPAGFVIVQEEQIQAFLDPLPVERLWGVGKVAARKLARLNIRTIADLRRYPAARLCREIGDHGQQLQRLARGIDTRPVVPEQQAKSVSNETTFAEDLSDRELLLAWLQQLTEQVATRLREAELKGRTVQIKVRYADFETVTRAQTLATPTHATREIWQTAKALFLQRLPERELLIRLIGVGVSGFDNAPAQADLFAAAEQQRQSQLDKTVDDIKRRFGSGIVKRGKSLLGGP